MTEVFRAAQRGELEEVCALYRRCADAGRTAGNCLWNEFYPGMEEAEADLAADGLFVLLRGGRLCASVSAPAGDVLETLPLPWSGGRCAVLARMAVTPALQRQGLGRRMLGLICREMRRRGVRYVRFTAAVGNPAACALYRRLGCREVGTVEEDGLQMLCFEQSTDRF